MLKARPGWLKHTLRASGLCVTFSICVCWKMIQRSGKKTRTRKVLLYACGGVKGGPHEICELYRRRFGIESSDRQLKQHRIRTSSRDPLFRLLFVGLALLLRNVWVWLHLMTLPKAYGAASTVDHSRLSLRHLVEILLLQSLAKNANISQTGNY